MKLFLSPGWDAAAAGAGGGEGQNSRSGGQQQSPPGHQVPRLHDGAYKVCIKKRFAIFTEYIKGT